MDAKSVSMNLEQQLQELVELAEKIKLDGDQCAKKQFMSRGREARKNLSDLAKMIKPIRKQLLELMKQRRTKLADRSGNWSRTNLDTYYKEKSE